MASVLWVFDAPGADTCIDCEPVRIAVTGSHSLGKSTVVNDWVAAHDG
jgi:hypothetical protein